MQVRDINGKKLKVGDNVRRAAHGSDVIPVKRRRQCLVNPIAAIGEGEHLAGLIKVRGALAWENPTSFERV